MANQQPTPEEFARNRARARALSHTVDTESEPSGNISYRGEAMQYWLPEGFKGSDIDVEGCETGVPF